MDFQVIDITLDGKRYKVKHAKTQEQRRHGLMNAESIDADGMLFEYPYSTFRAFYMAETSLPLVIAFFDQEGTFVGSRPLTPYSMRPVIPPRPFKYAIEFHADSVPEFTSESCLQPI